MKTQHDKSLDLMPCAICGSSTLAMEWTLTAKLRRVHFDADVCIDNIARSESQSA